LNAEINAPEIRLVGVEGEQLGIVSLAEALGKAEAAELDLVEIAPMAKPPVCRIMDYGKFKYREAKKQHEAKLKLKQIQVKEVKFRPGTDEGDYKIKLRNLTRFLSEGDKAKVTLRFRGREMAHQEFGVRLLEPISSRSRSSSSFQDSKAGKW
jgi:translation initiation factor IF-3